MAYTFINAEKTFAQRDTDGAFVPWNPALNQPADIVGLAGQLWKAAGSQPPNPYVAAAAAPPPVSKVQAMIALQRSGKLDAVKAVIAADPEMQIWFDNAPTWNRDSARVAALGLTEQDLDDLFAVAQTVTA